MYSVGIIVGYISFFFFKQKTAYEMRISDWSSDVCSSDLVGRPLELVSQLGTPCVEPQDDGSVFEPVHGQRRPKRLSVRATPWSPGVVRATGRGRRVIGCSRHVAAAQVRGACDPRELRSEEHTSELQSLMRNSYAVFCLTKKQHTK